MKKICLGTALWGWSVNKNEAFAIMDQFYDAGYRHVDTANNYPMNGLAESYQKSAHYISEWCKYNNVKDLKITYKIGSLSNTFVIENNLSPKFLKNQISHANSIFSNNLHCLMIHWDNRDDLKSIEETLFFLNSFCSNNKLSMGLSGIKNIQIYRDLLYEMKISNINIQLKHNFLFSDLNKYAFLSGLNPRIWAYGISMGGIKLTENEYNHKSYVPLTKGINYHKKIISPEIESMLQDIVKNNDIINNIYHLAIIFSEQENSLYGYNIAPSKLSQMKDLNEFFIRLDIATVNSIKLSKLKKLLKYAK